MKQQFNQIHQELSSVQDQLTRVNRQIHDKDLRLAQLNSDLENLQHRFKLDTANHKIDLAKVQREYLEQQEQYKLQIQGFISSTTGFSFYFRRFSRLDLEEKLSAVNSDKNKLQLTIQEKEHQLLTNIQLTREDEWKKMSEITNEKFVSISNENTRTKSSSFSLDSISKLK